MKEAETIAIDTVPPARLRGKIVKIDKDKGYGFIITDEFKFRRYYFYWSYLKGKDEFMELEYMQEVEFTPHRHPEKGRNAFQVEVVS